MTLDDALGTYDWLPDGWVLASANLPTGVGVGVWNGKQGEASRRYAIMIPEGQEAEDTFPVLRDWIEQQ